MEAVRPSCEAELLTSHGVRVARLHRGRAAGQSQSSQDDPQSAAFQLATKDEYEIILPGPRYCTTELSGDFAPVATLAAGPRNRPPSVYLWATLQTWVVTP